ncbi:MAG TPA: hypothetical protein VE673_15345, partial [Pseudonocardiaceae bacterium]|nr:hypothetical protein [Pseudonocardiaceae bacterium]
VVSARAAVSAGRFRRRDSQGGLGGTTDVLPAMEFSLRELGDVSKTHRSRSLQVGRYAGQMSRSAKASSCHHGSVRIGQVGADARPRCLDSPTSGTYRLAGQAVSTMSEEELADVRNRRIGFVFEQFNLLPSLTAGRYVELPLCYADADRKSGLCLHHRRPRLLGQLHAAGRTIVLITQEAAVKAAAAARTMQIWTAPSALTALSACTRRRHTVMRTRHAGRESMTHRARGHDTRGGRRPGG